LGTKETAVIPTLQQGVWGDICRQLIDIYDEYIYRNWLSKLKVFVDESDKFITLQAPNTFVKQWVESTYGETIQKIAKNLSVEVRLC
jgi:chromosomal replication initiation ATPase DnaA